MGSGGGGGWWVGEEIDCLFFSACSVEMKDLLRLAYHSVWTPSEAAAQRMYSIKTRPANTVRTFELDGSFSRIPPSVAPL